MTTGERIRARRKELDLSADFLAKILGVSRSTVFRYENGFIEKMPIDTIEPIAKALLVTPAYLMGWEEEGGVDPLSYPNIYPIETRKFPLLGNIACGEPIFAEDDHETYIEADSSIRADFCLRAEGDSMINARIQDGDIVFIRKQEMVDNGDIAAVIIENEATLKRVYYDRKGNELCLVAENPKYRPLVYKDEELNHIQILGKAVYFMSEVI